MIVCTAGPFGRGVGGGARGRLDWAFEMVKGQALLLLPMDESYMFTRKQANMHRVRCNATMDELQFALNFCVSFALLDHVQRERSSKQCIHHDTCA